MQRIVTLSNNSEQADKQEFIADYSLILSRSNKAQAEKLCTVKILSAAPHWSYDQYEPLLKHRILMVCRLSLIHLIPFY